MADTEHDPSAATRHRHLPAVDTLLRQSPELLARWGHQQLTVALRAGLALLRQRIDRGEPVDATIGSIQRNVADQLEADNRNSLQAVLNLSGTVLHTNLGRACLPESAVAALCSAARNPSNLELDLSDGKRGRREVHVESLICELTGAEAATVVNNNAAAVLLALNTLAMGRQVPVSRGELVEIGGSFRIPEVMQRAGCTLVEIGSTNRTHLRDYEQAITGETALLMKVHASNYRLEGFTSEVPEQELASLARKTGIPFVIDLGSGSLVDFASLGLPQEPTAAAAIANGADLITFSGDKLLGGPQAGLIAGRRELIAQLDANPLKRALRLDKLALAAMEEVLKLYRNPSAALDQLPTLRQLTRPQADIAAQAERLAPLLSEAVAPDYRVSIAASASQIGSGALPVECLPSACLCVSPQAGSDSALRHLAAVLRRLPLPIIGRLQNGTLWLDLRCLEDEQRFTEQLEALAEAMA